MEEKATQGSSQPTQKPSSAHAESPLMHDFKQASTTGMGMSKLLIALIIAIFLGLGTGFVMAKTGVKTGVTTLDKVAHTSSSVVKGKTYGTDDTKTFSDTAEGVVKEGGVEGEGQYHLVRPGGDSQNVYMTSSNVDLSQFIDHKVKVWGQTQKAQTAGWLMDIGRVQVLD